MSEWVFEMGEQVRFVEMHHVQGTIVAQARWFDGTTTYCVRYRSSESEQTRAWFAAEDLKSATK